MVAVPPKSQFWFRPLSWEKFAVPTAETIAYPQSCALVSCTSQRPVACALSPVAATRAVTDCDGLVVSAASYRSVDAAAGEVVEQNATSVSIDFKGHKLTVPKDRAERHAGRITVGVRPEKATFHESAPAADSNVNLIGPGEIIDIRFTGVSNQYLIEIPNIGNVTVFAQNVGKSPVVELGAKVWVSFKVEHTFGLSDNPDNSGSED